MKNRTYVLHEDAPGLFTFEGAGGTVDLQELKALQALQPHAQWIVFCEPSTIIENKINNAQNE